MPPEFVIGIDLGTTNSVLAYAPVGARRGSPDPAAPPAIELLKIPQLVAPGSLESRTGLPSFLYLPNPAELTSQNFRLPGEDRTEGVVGEFARRQAAEQPQRTIGAAKSWLTHSKVDRRQPILPWGAPVDVSKISPVEASRSYLAHLAAAWNEAFPESPIARQHVVLTVPASFDVSARELTREAALAAGLPENLIMLEEPQAAVYAWLSDVGDAWRKHLKLHDRILVCDVGGGTTDFTLIAVAEEHGELVLKRAAIGNHLLVGGDNMDLALAHHAAAHFAEKGTKLDAWQSVSLWHASRLAKEALLGDAGAEKHPLTILGRGSKLIGGTVTIELTRAVAEQTLVDGFFPHCAFTDRPAAKRQSGFRELGLPYETDAAITKHLAAFLSAQEGDSDHPRLTHVLLNGGVFKSPPMRERLFEVLGSWGAPPKHLTGQPDLDHAVARGAAYYGWAKEHGGVRIRGGAARSYYVGIETSGLAIPGAARPIQALCVVPFGMEEGQRIEVPSAEVGLVVGETAPFRFFRSATRKQDRPGDMLSHWDESELEETDSLVATLPADESRDDAYVPVHFQSHVSELGVFELWCVSTTGDRRWKLEFSVREDAN
jgi:molecular chaperone DnaK (HSP70)